MVKRRFKKISMVCAMLLTLVCSTSFVLASENNYEPKKAPKIEYFTTSSENVAPGETVTLSWKVLGAKEVVITGEEKIIECVLEDSIEVWPMFTTEYTLHAYGFFGEEVTKTLLVKVGAAEIRSFTADPVEVAPGEAVTLSWDVYNADSVMIPELGDQAFPSTGSEVVNPYVDTTYTLVTTGYDGNEITQQVEVTVKKPEIVKFEADKTVIKPGETVVLAWEVLYAKNVTIQGLEKQPETNEGTIEVWPLATTTYILTAEAYDGTTVTKELTVVVEDPIITNFDATKTTIKKGELITLSWTTNAVKCSIETDLGPKLPNVPVNGKISVTPNRNIVFTLIATDADNNVEKQSIQITVIE